ncbi:uncharacterized protein [Spinacia oleracea]|uniref:Uncharacterized protein isoform X2 n=1 Tax=Spinacia oleracea TaxID=3562 RepID=A0ABM3QME3_SPIOL|nr:uncharacterized protein LOC110801128 isoform X2 [Spinacia oleracea]XP_056684519.1 uncharacterized protein LOC110801128 isoform X2 [Spinacia oleracea]
MAGYDFNELHMSLGFDNNSWKFFVRPILQSSHSPHISTHQLKRKMAAAQLTAATVSSRCLPTFEGLRSSSFKVFAFVPSRQGLRQRSFRPLVVKTATVVPPKLCFVMHSSFMALVPLVKLDI